MASEIELERFREEWLREVQRKAEREGDGSSVPTHSADKKSVPTSPSKTIPQSSSLHRQHPPNISSISPIGSSLSTVQHDDQLEYSGPSLRLALQTYRQAVDAEAAGALNNALQLYRRAFRLDNNVDKAYERAVNHSSLSIQLLDRQPEVSRASESKAPSRDEHLRQVHQPLSSIISSFASSPVSFAPENESNSVPIQLLPVELIVHILRIFGQICDYSTIETFASVSKKARLISMESTIWRDMVGQLYRSPQIPEHVLFSEVVQQTYGNDYRRAMIEHPRLRYDGVYIATCHYTRPGLSDNAWINVSHLITYHRYLRFFSNGTVLSLLANDDNPSEIVHSLSHSYRRAGFFIGTWSLSGYNVIVRDLLDPANDLNKYGFEMVLNLKSRPMGRWNKLELRQYSTIRLDSGEADDLPLKHERPFWFSKVRSYRGNLD